jgi:hypothetical protein
VINGRLTTVETKAGTAYTKASELDNKVGTMEIRLYNHADAIESLQSEFDNFEEHIVSRAVNGWPVLSPNGTLYAIFVNDDGTLRVGEYIEE